MGGPSRGEGVAAPPPALTTAETIAACALLAVGFVAAWYLEIYDARARTIRFTMLATSMALGFALFSWALAALRVQRAPRTAAALWSITPWSFLLSHLAYVGFYFLPIEILASALILRSRARLRPWWVAFLLAAAVRLAVLGVMYSSRPLWGYIFAASSR